MNLQGAAHWAGEHPVIIAGGVFVIGGLLLLVLSGNNGSANSNLGSAYFAAQAAQGVSGNQLQATQIAAQASTTQALAADTAAVTIYTQLSGDQLAGIKDTNATSAAIAPYAAYSAISGDLAGIAANAPPITTTVNKSNSGFLGIGASKSSTTTVTPNPIAVSAADEISGFLHGLIPGH